MRRLLGFAVVLAIGLGGGLLLARVAGGDAPPAATEPDPDPPPAQGGDPDALAALPSPGDPLPPDAATGPEEAVAGFLTAEALDDFRASYDFLSVEDRATYPTPEAWVQAHGDLPPIVAFEVEQVVAEADRAEVRTLTGYEPGLDQVLGLVPGRARSTWVAVREGQRWRVRLGESASEPLYPPDGPAAQVARAWAEARVACAATDELEQGLLGVPALGDRLCDAGGALRLGPVARLGDGDDTTTLVSAYGPEVAEWARVVAVDSPEPMQIVLAPLGPEWKVIAVARPPLAQGRSESTAARARSGGTV